MILDQLAVADLACAVASLIEGAWPQAGSSPTRYSPEGVDRRPPGVTSVGMRHGTG
jgi:hypothetical protein